jgi:hypothetical protein
LGVDPREQACTAAMFAFAGDSVIGAPADPTVASAADARRV